MGAEKSLVPDISIFCEQCCTWPRLYVTNIQQLADLPVLLQFIGPLSPCLLPCLKVAASLQFF